SRYQGVGSVPPGSPNPAGLPTTPQPVSTRHGGSGRLPASARVWRITLRSDDALTNLGQLAREPRLVRSELAVGRGRGHHEEMLIDGGQRRLPSRLYDGFC